MLGVLSSGRDPICTSDPWPWSATRQGGGPQLLSDQKPGRSVGGLRVCIYDCTRCPRREYKYLPERDEKPEYATPVHFYAAYRQLLTSI